MSEKEHYVVLIVDADDPKVFEQSQEVPNGFISADLAEEAITCFLQRADDAGFSYTREDFVIQRTNQRS